LLHQKAQLSAISSAVQILGPVPAFLGRKAGKHRAQLLLQSKERKALHQALQQLEQNLREQTGRRVRYSIDVDPLELG